MTFDLPLSVSLPSQRFMVQGPITAQTVMGRWIVIEAHVRDQLGEVLPVTVRCNAKHLRALRDALTDLVGAK